MSGLIAARGNIRRVSFTEDGRSYDCYVPEDSLWNAVKDNLILAEYERAGIDLRQFRGVVLDAGAHVGLFSLRAATYASRVVALEPHPGNFALLRINLLRNDVGTVEARNTALWDSAGEVELFEGSHTAEGSLLKSGTRGHRVQAVTLDELVDELGTVDLLKLDIEGSEFSVLDSVADEALAQVGAIVAELHLEGRADGDRAVAERLTAAGFDVVLLPPPVYFWRHSVARTLRRWRSVENVTRLKLTVLLMYTATAMLDAVANVRETTSLDELMFLYARRTP